ncbi:MAG: SUMF1/EgtB/PvdO family nonheme iron enzyme [Proteobacteria bacterium]|nr:SUMF1/EgtB/PvdO family nonheme iron enzyme [Pseudomonadota bacterium]
MKMTIKGSLVLVLSCFVLAAFNGCHRGPKNPSNNGDAGIEQECLEMRELLTSEVPTAGVRSVFQLLNCDGYPIPDLADDELEVLLDGEEIRTEGDVASVLTQEVNFESHALLLLDMSDSIVDNGNLKPMISAARNLVHKLVTEGHRISIYQFAGPQYFSELQEFTAHEAALDSTLDELETSSGLGTTDLYGSIPRALDVLEKTGNEDILTTRTLVIFTDGSDEAMAATRKSAEKAINGSDINVFTVGLGGDVDQEELIAFGKNGFEWAEDADKLKEAFRAVTQRISDLAHSHYLVGVCSPRAGGWRDMTLIVRHDGEIGRLTVHYDATGFDIVGCNSQDVAFPCKEKQCGDAGGLSCGTCQGTSYCTDELICEEACGREIDCGTVMGVDCGDCSGLGETFTCDTNACVDACSEVDCGTVLGMDCGDCSDLGESFTCDANHTCVNACAEAECGTVMGMDCGDCSNLGEDFGCDENHKCVEACAEAECGKALGIDCGSCDDEFECNGDNVCIPVSLPGMSWIKISGGDFTLGCDIVLDPACGLDETRHSVTLSDFWIMSTEVTVDMYKTCVDEGGCNASYVDTGSECNYGSGSTDRKDHPINCVAWDGLRQFCAYAGGRLLTEAEWERAFRGDHDDVLESYWIYPWGNTPAPSCSRVVMKDDAGLGCGSGITDKTGTKPSTSFGLSNMAGNVSEWVGDYYAETFEDCQEKTCVDPKGPADGSHRVVRGGAWNDFYTSAFRTARRDKEEPITRSPAIGGRCAK